MCSFLSLGMKRFDFDNAGLQKKLEQVRTKIGGLSFLRLVVFLAMICLFVLGIAESSIWFLFSLLSVVGFVSLIRKYNHLKDQEAIYLSLEKIEEEAQKRKLRELSSLDSGFEFQDKAHPFANDLDLFGDHSLFQLLNHSVSKGGKTKLAAQMKAGFDSTQASRVRVASKELSSLSDFLRAFETIGKAFYKEQKSGASSWAKWLTTEYKVKPWIKICAYLGPICGLLLIALIYFGLIPQALFGVWIVLGFWVLGMVFRPLKEAASQIPLRDQLKTHRYWVQELEDRQFTSLHLQESQAHFILEGAKASDLLDEFDKIGLWVQNRMNMLYVIVNLLFWTDLFLLVQLITWKQRHGKLVSGFAEQLENWEVLVSLGSFEFEVGGGGQVIHVENGLEGIAVSHPLLSPAKAIANDFTISDSQRIILLTGSNMSGKTTFMRTLGINCVLVNLGLAPYAKAFGFGSFQLYTSMRNSDNLGESVSSFYAELSRINRLIARLESGEYVFFLLDEILKGTNTEDRIAGSEALIRQVGKTRGMGIISTHDIELAQLQGRIDFVRNFSFHSEIHDMNIEFDYKIKEGACPSFNAHKLMELMGIRFQDNG